MREREKEEEEKEEQGIRRDTDEAKEHNRMKGPSKGEKKLLD